MLILMITVILFMIFLCVVIGCTIYAMVVKKATPQIYYTPFESITAQTHTEFHEEKEEREERADEGEDK